MDDSAITIRAVTAADIGRLKTIEQDTPEASRWSPEDYLAYECRVAEVSNQVVGYLLSRSISDTEFEVLNTAVVQEYRRRGIAQALLQSQLQQQQGTWYLEVRRSNSAARNLYKKLGFREIGERPGYYDNPPEPAIVMAHRS